MICSLNRDVGLKVLDLLRKSIGLLWRALRIIGTCDERDRKINEFDGIQRAFSLAVSNTPILYVWLETASLQILVVVINCLLRDRFRKVIQFLVGLTNFT